LKIYRLQFNLIPIPKSKRSHYQPSTPIPNPILKSQELEFFERGARHFKNSLPVERGNSRRVYIDEDAAASTIAVEIAARHVSVAACADGVAIVQSILLVAGDGGGGESCRGLIQIFDWHRSAEEGGGEDEENMSWEALHFERGLRFLTRRQY
jgi:hypothetical protein